MKKLDPNSELGLLRQAASVWLSPDRFASIFPSELFVELEPFMAPSPGIGSLLDLGDSVQVLVLYLPDPGFLNIESPEDLSRERLFRALRSIGITEEVQFVDSTDSADVSATPGDPDSGEGEA
jgi:hypothetical protein